MAARGHAAAPGEERSAMKALRFSDAQKAFLLKQGADGVPDLPQGRRQATYFNWKKSTMACCQRRCGV